MSREEAISNLRDMMGGMPFDKCFDWIVACSVAIRSLEAWDEILEEIKEYDFPISYSEYMSAEDAVKTTRNQMYSMFMEIITKHLEVEE